MLFIWVQAEWKYKKSNKRDKPQTIENRVCTGNLDYQNAETKATCHREETFCVRSKSKAIIIIFQNHLQDRIDGISL